MDLTQRTRSHHSELGDMSDSDWLDIASSRASEDDDSAAGFDSDREDAEGRPLSRRHSFSSLASSSDEVVEGWEGLIDDSQDETPLAGVEPIADLQCPADTAHNDLSPPAEVEEDPEDEQVKAALDQSMMSTLSSSRSNSLANSSIQASIVHSTRSLRLSFPDPTTSRLESLSTSFEELPPSDADQVPREDGEVASTGGVTAADPLRVPMPEPVIAQTIIQYERSTFEPPAKTTFNIVLYGSSLPSKMTFVNMLLKKWALGSDMTATEKVFVEPRTMLHHFKGFDSSERPLQRTVAVIDKTGSDCSSLTTPLKCPSLAVIFLPCISEISIPEHTLYLPVMMTSPLSPVDILGSTDYLLEAEQQWEAQGVSYSKLTDLSRRSSPVVDEEVVANASPEQIEQTLRPLLPQAVKKIQPKVSAHAITIMAILSIVIGYIVNGIADTSDSRRLVATAVANPLMNLLRPMPMAANKSMSSHLITIATPGSALSLSSPKDLQVSVFNPSVVPHNIIAPSNSEHVPSPASTSVPAATTTAVVKDEPSECECGCGLLTWPAKTETTDLMLRPTSSAPSVVVHTVNSISLIPSQTPIGKGKGRAVEVDTSLYALSTRMATSLSEYLGFSPMFQAVATDIQDIITALDQLGRSLSYQTAVAWEQTKSVMAVVGSGFNHRNSRAKARAQQIRDVGGLWFSSMRDRFVDRATVAKENARTLRRQMKARHLERYHKRQADKRARLERKLQAVREKSD